MGTFLRFLQNYCAAVTKKYWALEKQEISSLTISALFRFLGHILNISKTIFTKVIFHLWIRDQLKDVLLHEF